MKSKKEILKHVGSFIFFAVITIVFFLPQYQGKVLIQGDLSKWKGMAQETITYHEETGENVAWCGSMFSGMPGYTVCIRHNYPNALLLVEQPFRIFTDVTGAILLLSLVCGYILCLSIGCSIPISILGAIAFAFSSYFPIIIEAGHATKGWVMATMPLVITGILLILKKKRLFGGLVFTIALTGNILHGHIQITYYLLILCIFIFLGYIYNNIKEKNTKDILHSTIVLSIGTIIALVLNSAQLFANYEMSQKSTRGRSELTSNVDGKQDKSSGLDQDYAYAWSYGKGETLTLLIPNFYGGASGGVLDKNSNLAKAFRKNNYQAPSPLRTYTYWGDQPFTSGPVYFGAIICFLFILSLFIVKEKYKWWIVAASAFLIIMSWGKNLPFINDILFHYLPFYNKFRTPSMALVIPQLTFAWLSCLSLKALYDKDIDSAKKQKYLIISGGITGGICLIFSIMPSVFLSFSSEMDASYQLPEWYLSALIEDRAELLKSDAWRSFLFIAVAFAALFISIKTKREKVLNYCIVAVTLLCFIDLWGIDRRYLNESNFVRKTKSKEFAMTEADKFILQDKDPSYRVLTLNNPFNDTNVSYYHKSIGGYNAAKLRRYQDLIDLHIDGEMKAITESLRSITSLREADSAITYTSTPVLDMLNMKYLIINPDMPAATNYGANGNAWFIQEVKYVENADEEMTSLNVINPKTTAVVDKSFAQTIPSGSIKKDSNATIEMTSYEPICQKYVSNSSQDNVALFSEIYYKPGWKAFIDGKEVEHFRANWVLRGLFIPAGKHDIEFKFEPDTYWNLTLLSTIGSFILVGLIITFCILQFLKQRKVTANN